MKNIIQSSYVKSSIFLNKVAYHLGSWPQVPGRLLANIEEMNYLEAHRLESEETSLGN